MENLEETDQERVSTGRSPGAHRFAIGVLRGASKRALPTSFFCLRKLFLPERVIAIDALEQLSQFRLIGQRSWPRERRHQQVCDEDASCKDGMACISSAVVLELISELKKRKKLEPTLMALPAAHLKSRGFAG